MIIKVEILDESNADIFKNKLSQLLNQGYKLETSSVGFVNSEEYNFKNVYQALLLKTQDSVTRSPLYKIGQKVKIVQPDLLSAGAIGKIVGYQGPMLSHKKTDYTVDCMYVITYFDEEDKMDLTYAFELGSFIILED